LSLAYVYLLDKHLFGVCFFLLFFFLDDPFTSPPTAPGQAGLLTKPFSEVSTSTVGKKTCAGFKSLSFLPGSP
jgi:hypothetical protein